MLSRILVLLLVMAATQAHAQQLLVESIRAGNAGQALDLLAAREADADRDLAALVNQRSADGSTALHWASYHGAQELVQALLSAGAVADVTNNYGSTPLMEAVKLNSAALVSMLLDAGADPDSPNQDQQTALMIAAFNGSLEVARMLLDHGADVNAIETFRGQNALMWAAAEAHPALVELLLSKGADVNVRAAHDDWPRQMTSEPRAQYRATGGLTALLYATRSGCLACAVQLVEAGADVDRPNPDGITPLINALDNKNFDIAMYLIDAGANVHAWDMYGRTPLYVAVDMNSFNPRSFDGFGDQFTDLAGNTQQYRGIDVARRLVGMGVDVNHQLTQMRPNGPGRGRFVDYDMRGGTGPLMVAVLWRDLEAIELLLQNGAEVDLPNVFRMTPLMLAAGMSGSGRGQGDVLPQNFQEASLAAIDLLVAAGADLNAQVTGSRTLTGQLDSYVQHRDSEGRTALHAAAELAWERVVARLLELGADPAITDAQGQTALDEALEPELFSAPSFERTDVGDREATVAILAEVSARRDVDQ